MRIRFLICATLLFVATSSRLQADPVTLTGQGKLVLACGVCLQTFLGFSAEIGDPFSFSLSFDSRPVPDLAPEDPLRSGFTFGPGNFTLTIGTHNVGSFAARISGGVANNQLFGLPGSDQLDIEAVRIEDDGRISFVADVTGFDPKGRLLTADAWPTDIAATLSAAPIILFRLEDPAADFSSPVDGRVTTVTATTPTPTPEPATMLLLGATVAGIAGRRWRWFVLGDARSSMPPRCDTPSALQRPGRGNGAS